MSPILIPIRFSIFVPFVVHIPTTFSLSALFVYDVNHSQLLFTLLPTLQSNRIQTKIKNSERKKLQAELDSLRYAEEDEMSFLKKLRQAAQAYAVDSATYAEPLMVNNSHTG